MVVEYSHSTNQPPLPIKKDRSITAVWQAKGKRTVPTSLWSFLTPTRQQSGSSRVQSTLCSCNNHLQHRIGIIPDHSLLYNSSSGSSGAVVCIFAKNNRAIYVNDCNKEKNAVAQSSARAVKRWYVCVCTLVATLSIAALRTVHTHRQR